MENFSDLEKSVLFNFLNELMTRFSCDGCNDFELPNTDEGIKLYQNSIKASFSNEEAEHYIKNMHVYKDKIICNNFDVLNYLIFKLR